MQQVLTRCPSCLDLTLDPTRTCINHTPKQAEKRAARLLHSKGYIVRQGQVLLLLNDDPEDFQTRHIAAALDSLADTYHALEQADWPQAADWLCPGCGEGRVDQLETICAFCQLEQAEESDGRRRWRLLP